MRIVEKILVALIVSGVFHMAMYYYLLQRRELRSEKLRLASTQILHGTNRTTTIDEVKANTSIPQSAYEMFGLSELQLMEPMKENRPLMNFTLTPRKMDMSNEKFAESVNITQNEISWSMIVVVKSHIDHVKRRELVRQSWSSFKYINGVRIETVFVLGIPKDENSQKQIRDESNKFGDLLQINRSEEYTEIGLKTLAGMQWVKQNFPPSWIYTSADDDMMPDWIRVIESIEDLMKKEITAVDGLSDIPYNNPNFSSRIPMYCGYVYDKNAGPFRKQKNKYYVSLDLYPLKEFPPFCYGGWYSLPVVYSNGIYDLSRNQSLFHLDDAWITGMLRLKYFSSPKSHCPRCDVKDINTGIWPVLLPVPNRVVKHEWNEDGLVQSWKSLEPILQNAKKIRRTAT